MGKAEAVFIHSPKFDEFSYPADCPFNVSRAGKVREVLNSMGLLTGAGRSEVVTAPAERIVLKKFHSARYLHTLQTVAKGQRDIEAMHMGIGTADCPIFEDMYEYSALACGATLTGAKLRAYPNNPEQRNVITAQTR